MKITDSLLYKLKLRLERVNYIENNAYVDPCTWISGSVIGPKVAIAKGCKILKAEIVGEVKIDRYTSLWGPNIHIDGNIKGVQIGAFCSIAHHVSIHEPLHNIQRTTTYFINRNLLGLQDLPREDISYGPIEIKNDVWIGAGATILSGVKIGNGAVIGAGAVVSRDIPPYAVAAGVPASIIRYRFGNSTIKRIADTQWWTWSEERLRQEVEFLTEIHQRG